jgi:hypothetical protein
VPISRYSKGMHDCGQLRVIQVVASSK